MDYVIRSCDFLKMKMGSTYISRSYDLLKKEIDGLHNDGISFLENF